MEFGAVELHLGEPGGVLFLSPRGEMDENIWPRDVLMWLQSSASYALSLRSVLAGLDYVEHHLNKVV